MLDLGRLPVFVSAENADIEIEARVFEIVRIAAIKRDLLLRREDQAHVIVAFEAIKMVDAALIKRDDIGAQAGLFFASFSISAMTFWRAAAASSGDQSWFHRAVHAGGHVFDRHEHIELEIGRAWLVRLAVFA